MKPKVKVIDGNKIFLKAMKGAGIEIPKTKEEVFKLLDEIDEGMKKQRKRN